MMTLAIHCLLDTMTELAADVCPNCFFRKDRRAKCCRRCFRFGDSWNGWIPWGKDGELFEQWCEKNAKLPKSLPTGNGSEK